MAAWEPTRMKSQLRLTSQKLGQLQDRMESQAQITQRDIATLLQQGNVPLARAKARKLINEDTLSDLLQTLEMHVGMILGHLGELERSGPPSSILLEAASSIIVAAPQIDSKDLRIVRDILLQRLGTEFARSVDDYVSLKVRDILSVRPPSAARLDQYLFGIAKTHGVQWYPDLQPHEKVNALSEILDPSAVPVVDLARLRTLCAHGLPDYPPWLRPKIWRLLLGTLPVEKGSWGEADRKSRENYYDLIRRLLEPFSSLPPPTTPLASLDATLLTVSKELAQVPPQLMTQLQETQEPSPLCPLEETAPEDIRIGCANDLDIRLRLIREAESKDDSKNDSTPEIRLESTPEIRLDAPENNADEHDLMQSGAEQTDALGLTLTPGSPSSGSTTLHPSRPMGAHPRHASALLRLLYVHSCLNPANQSPHIGSLLVPVYSALVEEVAPEDAAHIEADTFWLFEVVVGELIELNDVEGGNIWTGKFSERLYWADPELADDLQLKGLDPALPHYSFRWLVPVLTHTLPLPSVLTVWDALFSRNVRERGVNPKLEYLLDICTSMLLRARTVLLRLGRPSRRSSNMWFDEIAAIPATPLSGRELEDAFAEGMSFLQQYPVEAAGGIEVILQTAYDLTLRREAEASSSKSGTVGLGVRLRDTVWKGFATQPSIIESQHENEESDRTDSEEETESEQITTRGASSLTSRLADTVWRGISNQSAMEAPPSPTSPYATLPPSPEPPAKILPEPPTDDTQKVNPSRASKIWGYAEKFRESDTAATLAKVSTNWRVKAFDAWNKRSSGSSSTFLAPPSSSRPSSVEYEYSRRTSLVEETFSKPSGSDKRRGGSLPGIDRSEVYSPPARPAYFHPPRDSIIFTGNKSPLSPTNHEKPLSDAGSPGSSGFRASLASLGFASHNEPPKPPSKSAPRPLLLNSASLITSPHSRSPTPSSADRAWADSVRGKRPSPVHQDSISSISSVSPNARFSSRGSARSELESDTGSRIVPLRSARSPRPGGSRHVTPTSSITSSPPSAHRRMDTETSAHSGSDDGSNDKGWSRVDLPESPPTGPSPPPPRTPEATAIMTTDVRVEASEPQQSSLALGDANDTESEKPVSSPGSKLSRRPPPLSRLSVGGDMSEDSPTTQAPPRSPRLKSKRAPPRLATRTQKNAKSENGTPAHDTLAPERPGSDELDNATTPRATSFDATFPTTSTSPRPARRVRKASGEGNGEVRTRKLSGEGRERVKKGSVDGRGRKVSGEREVTKHKRDSSAVQGDDEGYNDLLSAYESEDA